MPWYVMLVAIYMEDSNDWLVGGWVSSALLGENMRGMRGEGRRGERRDER